MDELGHFIRWKDPTQILKCLGILKEILITFIYLKGTRREKEKERDLSSTAGIEAEARSRNSI